MIHMFRLGDTRMVLDVPSGVIHEVDELAWDIIDLHKGSLTEDEIATQLTNKYSRNDIQEALKEVKALEEEQLLFTADKLQGYNPSEDDAMVKALCLHIAHDCNMRCRYCFASTGNFGGNRELMPLEVGLKAIDFLMQSSGSRRHLEIDFFGGEPLLGFDVVKELVRYGNSKAVENGKIIRYTLTTNGVLLNEEVRDFLNEHDIQVIMSLDGRQEINDYMRPIVGGEKSHDVIVPKFQDMAESRNHQNYHIRGTFTSRNLDFCNDIIHMLNLGFTHVSFEPVVTDPDKPYAIRKEHLPEIFAEYEKLADLYEQRYREGQPFTFFHFEIDPEQGPCIAKRLSGCGAGFDYLAVAPNGDLYACHQFVGIDEFKVGNVSHPTRLNRTIQKRFLDAHIFNKERCKDCWAKYYCSGGCHASAYFANRSLLEPEEISCALQKKRLECALAIRARLKDK